jgi:ribosome biogenesis GTPase
MAVDNSLLLCTRRARLKKIGQKVMVGDQVLLEDIDWQDCRGAIAKVLPRRTELQRPPVANADQILLMFALEEPSLDPWQLSRFLIKAESTGLDLCLCLNKVDLLSSKQQEQWQQRLNQWGYEPVLISVVTQQGLSQLLRHLNDKITILAGPSGVGKSSLINQLIPQVNQRVNEVSGKLQKGRHTTRHVELFELSERGLLADTPGFNQPELDCHPQELALYFPEAKAQLAHGFCQFNDCLHRDEPNCLVRGDWERYEYYLKFLDEAIARQVVLEQKPDQESSWKLKITSSGQQQYEPKLESKKYRRHSRRKKNQTLHQQYENQILEEMENFEDDDS